jgi:hypothetical protein
MCGTTVGTGAAIAIANGNTFQMNTLELQEDTKSRSVRISFSDAAVSSIGETINQLGLDKLAPRGLRPFKAPVTSTGAMPLLPPANQDGEGDQVIDTQATAALAPIAGDAERIRHIFESDGEDFKLEEDRLKADSGLEYARRLTYLFIYAHELAGRKPISYGSVKKILEVSKVLDTNTRHELGQKMAVEIEGDTIRLKKGGREKAIQALNEILDSNHPDPGWTPESRSRTAKNGSDAKEARPRGQVGRKRSKQAEEWAAKWEKHTDHVAGHFMLKGKTVLDKAVLALWAIHKVGGKAASARYIQRFITHAFSFNEKERSIDTLLQRKKRKNGQEFVIKTDGGYKLTPSGAKHAEQIVKVVK